MKRDDLIHPELSGNKWRKLKYNLLLAKQQKKKKLLTFGGAFSNHIHAVSAAGHLLGFETVGVIRGERAPVLSPTLMFAESMGMQLHFVTRAAYRNKTEPDFISTLKDKFGDIYLIPEGGSNQYAVKGAQEIIEELDVQLPGEGKSKTYICSACGTGGTLAGLFSASASGKKKDEILGFPVLKNADWMYDDIFQLLNKKELEKGENWKLILDYHFGGYAKYNKTLINFINQFKNEFSIQLEPIYTGKLLFGIFDLIKKDYFPKGSTIVALHTGGLQGLDGISGLERNKKV